MSFFGDADTFIYRDTFTFEPIPLHKAFVEVITFIQFAEFDL